MDIEGHHSYLTQRIAGKHITIETLVEAGPRIVRLFLNGSEDNQLQELVDRKQSTPYGDYFIRGGHRLWHSPEAFPRTYIPDNTGVEVEVTNDGVCLTGPLEPQTGIRKYMDIQLLDDRPALIVEHRLQNDGVWPVEFAAWALTVLPLGGLAILPQPVGHFDSAGLLPNRNLVIWPYSSLRDDRLRLDDEFISIQAAPKLPPLKIGYMNRTGWIGYLRQGVFFVKHFKPQPEKRHVDFGCNVETFTNDQFIELETVGPLVKVEPGESLHHTEIWEFFRDVSGIENLQDFRDLAASLNLPTQ